MSASNMFSMMLHRTIFVFTIITAAVNSGPNRSRELKPREYQVKEVSTEIEDKPNQSIHHEENIHFRRLHEVLEDFNTKPIFAPMIASYGAIFIDEAEDLGI